MYIAWVMVIPLCRTALLCITTPLCKNLAFPELPRPFLTSRDIWLFHLTWNYQFHSFCHKYQDLTVFCMAEIYSTLYLCHIFNSFNHWWVIILLQHFGYCKYVSNEYGRTGFSFKWWSCFFSQIFLSPFISKMLKI